MSKTLTHLMLFVLLLGLIPTGALQAADPSLELWLELEGNANDSSGNARHGTITGDTWFVDGVFGQGMEKNNNEDSIVITGYKGVLGDSSLTVSAWIAPNSGQTGEIVAWGAHHSGNPDQSWEFRINNGRLRVDHGGGNIQGTTTMNEGEWHHVAVTRQAGSSLQHPGVKIWLDGADDTLTSTGDAGVTNITASFDVTIGLRHSEVTRSLNGRYDDIRIYSRALAEAEIYALSLLLTPVLQSPPDKELLGSNSVLLEWRPARHVAAVDGHEIFLSNVFEDVNSAAPAASQGTTSNTFLLLSSLDVGKVYYWAVVDSNAAHPDQSWMSDVWSFTVPDVNAWNPSPADGAQYIDINPTLRWEPAMNSILQIVYFGTSYEDVSTATDGPQQPGTEFTPPGPLPNDTEHFWRIDTITGAGTMKGQVWSFRTEPDLPITGDPNLVGYWKLDINEPSATIAVDHSGYDNHGSLRGDAQFVAGYIDEAVQFDGDGDYINVDGYKGVVDGRPFTTVAWIKTTRTEQFNTIISWGAIGAGQNFDLRIDSANTTPYSLRTSQGNGNVQCYTAVNDGEWHHVAVTVIANATASSSDMRIYVDGQDDTRDSVDTDPLNLIAGADLGIGWRASSSDRPYEGLIDEVRLYDRVLSAVEVARLMDPSKAVNPSPQNNARDVTRTPTLTWTPGIDETTGLLYTKHNVYFSDDIDEVISGSVAPVVITGPNSYTPGVLPYYDYQYWRVDGVGSTGQISEGFIWNFKVTYDPSLIVDPNLRAWYKLDGDGSDSSGYGRDLIMNGEPGYVDAIQDLGLAADGVDDFGVYEFLPEEWSAYTITAWAKLDALNAANNESVFSSFGGTTDGFQIDVNGTSDTYRFNGENEQATFGPESSGWVHLAVAFDGLRAALFYNGKYVTTLFTTEGTFDQFGVGTNRSRGTLFGGVIDDVRIYDRELTDPEIVTIMRGNLALAWNPNPSDGASGVDLNPTLSWTPGDYATGHYVYFGADNPANMTLATVPTQPQSPNNFDPGNLDLSKTYYWQIGEVNGAGMDLGRIWSFSTIDHFVVDDMDGYLPANGSGSEMWQVWADGMGDCAGSGNGSGANVSADPNGFAGSQGMRYDYDHDGTVVNPCMSGVEGPRSLYYSKATVAIADLPSGIGSDWTAAGIRAFSLQFLGDTDNVVEPMWIQLSDATKGLGTKVFYGDYEGEDVVDLNDGAWHEWFIDLADCGIDLTNVVSISIGIGTEGAAMHDASGTMRIDDLRLYGPRCMANRAKPPADFDNSCDVGMGDLPILFGDWALHTFDFTVVAPSGDGLEARYEFENNLNDSVGGHNATEVGTVSYAAGTVGSYALSLDGTNNAVATGYKGVLGTQDRTTTAWIKTSGSAAGTMMIVNWGTQTGEGGRWAMRINQPPNAGAAGGFRADFDGGNLVGTTDLRDGAWHHVAAVLESDGAPRAKNIAIYVDGRREALTNATGRDIDISTVSDNDVTIGAAYFDTTNQFTGQIDDLRIYGRALSSGEIAGMAELTLGASLTESVRSQMNTPEDTDLVPDGAINFIDYATLLNMWLDEVLWPE